MRVLYKCFRMTKIQNEFENCFLILSNERARSFYFVIHLLGAVENVNHNTKSSSQIFSGFSFSRSSRTFFLCAEIEASKGRKRSLKEKNKRKKNYLFVFECKRNDCEKLPAGPPPITKCNDCVSVM